MKLTFDANLSFQQDAIDSVVDIFKGQPLSYAISEYGLSEKDVLPLIHGVANNLVLSERQILTNIQGIQSRNEINPSTQLDGMHFSVEMETGTGKTYVYIRTMYELHKLYGFKKFVIAVPSIAIREGALKNLQITAAHFQQLYEKTPINFQVYDSGKVSNVRGFATNNIIEILIINIDSFAKDENIINKPNDKLSGQKPIEFIQATRPIVIVDEPQNMETEKRSSAIKNLNALCTLRYSATHTHHYNLVYSLDPVQAYDLGLVKQIEVDSISEQNAANDAFVSVESITSTKSAVFAKVSLSVNSTYGVKQKTFKVACGDNLYDLSNKREIYKDGYLISNIDVEHGYLELSNGNILSTGQQQGALTDEVMRFQMERTVEEHLKREILLNKKGIKVLSLFFIDKVANYRSYDQSNNPVAGKLAKWFEEIYQTYIKKAAYQSLAQFDVAEIHNGYFSQDKKGIKDTSGTTKADDDTYRLIMRDKEKLLSIDTPLRFIFSHSALREGWDNPNVFQICTLNETKSELKKRQEIGRGLRLAVDGNGERIYDKSVNSLTVIANESYEDFAKALQQEIEDDCGVQFTGRIKDKRRRATLKYRKGFTVDPKFLEIWEKIKKKTNYHVYYDTDALITAAAKEVRALPTIKSSAIHSSKVRMTMDNKGIDSEYLGQKMQSYATYSWKIPDVLGYIQSKTELTRDTIAKILHSSGRIDDAAINPQLFLDCTAQAINRVLRAMMIDGIKYQQIANSQYEMTLFESQELEFYKNDFTFTVGKKDKTIYERYIPLDSNVESKFAKDCESSEQIQFYFKLPSWFTIPTPIGTYNPDWVLVFVGDKKIYFIAETKSSGAQSVDITKLRGEEQAKIKCGKAHFEHFKYLDYRVVKEVRELIE